MFLGAKWTAFTSHLLSVFVFFMDSVKNGETLQEKNTVEAVTSEKC